MSPVSWSVSGFFIIGPTMSRAEINCELTFPAICTYPPSRFRPLMSSGGYPWALPYSTSAPSLRSESTSTPMGRCCIRSVPVMTCSPGVTLRKAVMNRMAVPAALMFIS